jgi:hypothetical protein
VKQTWKDEPNRASNGHRLAFAVKGTHLIGGDGGSRDTRVLGLRKITAKFYTKRTRVFWKAGRVVVSRIKSQPSHG